MKHDVREWLTEAIMSKTPLIVVEGYDDIKFYDTLATAVGKDVWVDAIENFDGYTEGCDSVVKCMEEMQDIISERPENITYVMGVIDRDARFYRGEIPNCQGLFILKYYSYETHFVTRSNVEKLVSYLTTSSSRLIDDKTLDFITKNVDYTLLYYMSLEALKNACIREYNGDVGYKEKPGRILKDNVLAQKILSKKEQLDQFAAEKNIKVSDIKLIAKGKWILHYYLESVMSQIEQLPAGCSTGIINQCNFCKTGRTDKCQWKVINKFNIGQITNLFLRLIDDNEVGYIKERLQYLA